MEKFMKKILKVFRRILDWIVFIFSGKGAIADEGIESGLLDFSGQGRDRYGR